MCFFPQCAVIQNSQCLFPTDTFRPYAHYDLFPFLFPFPFPCPPPSSSPSSASPSPRLSSLPFRLPVLPPFLLLVLFPFLLPSLVIVHCLFPFPSPLLLPLCLHPPFPTHGCGGKAVELDRGPCIRGACSSLGKKELWQIWPVWQERERERERETERE